ncbi:MAG: hypothetical protein K2G63_02440 [Oscillospiraceae bacterium]|nr:hypothetical protein [Oscillospiraceae bacterium]
MYDESHEDIVVGNHMYTSISTGSYVERKDRKQTIYDVNLEEYTMTPLLEIEGGIPYHSFTVAGDKLIVAELLETGQTDLVEYDLSAEYENIPLVHNYDEQDIFTDNSIRHITADDDAIYMVRLSFDREKDDNYVLYMDTYDYDLNLLHTVDISDICNSDNRSEDNSENERKQWVANFSVNDKYILYQNFSSTIFIGSVENQKIKRLMNIDNSFGIVSEKTSCPEKDLLFKRYGNEKSGRNTFYLVNSKTGEISKSDFYADDKRYTFGSASINSDNMILLTMSYVRIKSDDEQLSDCLYYLNLDDLLFISL